MNREEGLRGATWFGLASPTFGDSWLWLRCWKIASPRGWGAARRRGRTSEGEWPAKGSGEYAKACEQGGGRPQAWASGSRARGHTGGQEGMGMYRGARRGRGAKGGRAGRRDGEGDDRASEDEARGMRG